MKILYGVGFHRNFTGSQRSLALLVSHLPETIEPVVVVLGRGRAGDEFARLGHRVAILETPAALDQSDRSLLRLTRIRRAWLVGRYGSPFLLRALRLIRRERPDIVHCNDARALAQLGPAARLLGVPVIWHLRGANVFASSRLANLLANAVSTSTISVAHAVAAPPRRHGTNHVVHNGIEMPEQTGVGADQAVADLLRTRGLQRHDVFVLVTASSFVPYKGLHHLLTALAALVHEATSPPVVWLALGAPTTAGQQRYRDHLVGEAGRLEIDRNLVLVGWVDDAVPWMAAADLVVLPTVQHETFVYPNGERLDVRCEEGLPRTLLEAMVAGRAAVASDVAGVAEQIEHGRSGLLVPAGEEVALADAIRKLRDDPGLRRAMDDEMRLRAARFAISATAERTVDVYRAVTGGPASGQPERWHPPARYRPFRCRPVRGRDAEAGSARDG